jgi:hypothetical protein
MLIGTGYEYDGSVFVAGISSLLEEEFEDTKGVIQIRKSKKNRQHNGKKKDKRTNNDLQNIHKELIKD